MAFTNSVDANILNLLFGATAYAASSSLYFGLSTSTITADGLNITEPSGGAYARVAVTNNTTNFPAVTDVFPVGTIAWAASTAYALNANVYPSTANGHYYTCTTAGTSAATAPAWPTTEGATVTDGTVVWTCKSSQGKQKQNGIAIAFPAATASWGIVTYWFVSDAVTGGNILAFGALGTSKTISNGDTASFAANQLTIQLQ